MAYVEVGVPLPLVTFVLCHAPPTLTLAHPNPSTLLEDPGEIIEDSEDGLVIVCWWCCSTHPGSGSCHCVGGVVEWH